jgi:hypothetical protein
MEKIIKLVQELKDDIIILTNHQATLEIALSNLSKDMTELKLVAYENKLPGETWSKK